MGNVIVGAAVLAAVALAVRALIKGRRSPCCGCGKARGCCCGDDCAKRGDAR